MINSGNNKFIVTLLAMLVALLMNTLINTVLLAKETAKETAFDAIEFEQIKQQHMGRRWLMLLWSVDCPPCFKELKMINNLSQQVKDLAIVIVNTDEQVAAGERQQIIDDYQLQRFQHFYFEDGKNDHNRFVIDPTWYGELPRSYFVDANGKFHGKSGLINEAILSKWLIPSKSESQ
ncbi:TlpA family protein disulfide reductase [Thalassotalea sp. ND16A]|uniref:TlpA family protein disulfide reductase n=1 Tax=Thalassotalea sp. ND16A TaxID=1535422 RepID=UPI00051A541F|nr:redoxin domain-containing protein [Thalassotalea sp. ND16A]KGK00390.1 hypothetical protein ND16A_3597 [Thalassotalea sp. ND16A]